MSFFAGLSDITPFILNLLGNNDIGSDVVVTCSMQAMVSNILVNMLYAFFFSGRRKEMRKILFIAFSTVIAVNILVLAISYLL